jgi:signal peptidase I
MIVIAVIVVLVAAGLYVARRRLLVIDVVGNSMSPTYASGDRLLVRRTRRARTGDVVIAHHQEGGHRDARTEPLATTWLVKRMAALPGEAVPEPVLAAVDGQRSVPAGMAVLLGEDEASADSRTWGFVPLADIAGVVVTRLTRVSDTESSPGQPR